ncbi:DUF2283 domain-containing protein [Candidatus Woesearchaeota archaeon]|nr:DUF2283 domain-containing protein [Candidatus Woesearchaeota archaeon]
MVKTLSYDREQDILVVHKGFSREERFKGNIDAGDVILDVSTKGRVRGVEILEASSFFKDFRIPKSVLTSLIDADFQVQMRPHALMLGFSLKTKTMEKELPMKVRVPLEVPL